MLLVDQQKHKENLSWELSGEQIQAASSRTAQLTSEVTTCEVKSNKKLKLALKFPFSLTLKKFKNDAVVSEM